MNSKSSLPSTAAKPLTRCVALGCAAVLLTNSSQAAFHLWSARELFTNIDGTLQYIEFFTSSGGQTLVAGKQVNVSNVGNTITHSFTLPTNFGSDTTNHAFLIGTAALAAASGVTPDYIMANGFLFAGGGTLSFFGANSGTFTALPTNGTQSYTYPAGTFAANTPQNFAGVVGSVPEPTSWAMLGIGGAGLCLLLRRRVA